MTEILIQWLSLGFFVSIPFVAAVILALAAPWLLKQPQHWTFFAILLFSLPTWLAADGGTDGSLFKQLTWSLLFLYAGLHVFGIFGGKTHWSQAVSAPMPLVLLVAYATLSVAWSPMQGVSAKRAIQLVGVLLIGMMVARQALSGAGLQRQLLAPASAFLLIGLAFSALAPGTAFSDEGMRAITSHKNTWGQFSLLAFVVLLFSFIQGGGVRKWRYLPLILAALACLLLSKSTTSLLSGAIILGVALTVSVLRLGAVGWVILFAFIIALTTSMLGFAIATGELPLGWAVDQMYRLTGKSETLTGRSFLWYLMETQIHRHPWLGIGFGGFWAGLDGPSAEVVVRLNWGPPSQAHSGYLDLVNELGFVGVFLLAVAFADHARKLVALARAGVRDEVTFHAALALTVLIINYAETSLLRATHLWWIVFSTSLIEIHVRYRALPKHSRAAPNLVPNNRLPGILARLARRIP